MLAAVQPEIVTIATPGASASFPFAHSFLFTFLPLHSTTGAYFKSSVLACAACETVRAIQVEKPFGGPLEVAYSRLGLA